MSASEFDRRFSSLSPIMPLAAQAIEMSLSVITANDADAPAIAALRNAVAEHLTLQYGKGHWSGRVTERGVLWAIKTSRVLIVKDDARIVATLRLATKKPWAIDVKHFVNVRRPLYLTGMAVEPGLQGKGIGRILVEEAKAVARTWSGEAIRLDAYDAEAGAGTFYVNCGFREVGRVTYRNTPLVYYELLL
jgi:GNAT superfamily N-acetyltransferase